MGYVLNQDGFGKAIAELQQTYRIFAPVVKIGAGRHKDVDVIIYDEIKQGEQGSREKFAHIDRAIRRAGCDCAILGCTELSVFRSYHNLPPYYVDAMEVLAELAVVRCGKQLRKI